MDNSYNVYNENTSVSTEKNVHIPSMVLMIIGAVSALLIPIVTYPCSIVSLVMSIKESLIKSRLTAWHAYFLHNFRHIAQKILDRRQPACGFSAQSDENSDCAICAPDLISASLTSGALTRRPMLS